MDDKKKARTIKLKESKVGDKVICACPKCKRLWDHSVHSILKNQIDEVKCEKCADIHRYADPLIRKKVSRKRPVKISPRELWEKKMAVVATAKKIPYTFSGFFKENDLIDHNTFGLGFVTRLLTEDKIQVLFQDGEKVLVARR